MTSNDPYLIFNRKDVADKQVDTLIGLCKGIAADGVVSQQEAEFLQGWLAANEITIQSNPITATLLSRVNDMLADGVLDREEAQDLLAALRSFAGETPEVGEFIKTTSLPVNRPEPPIKFADRRFCFTGTFGYGSRTQCANLIETLGGTHARTVTMKLDYLVLGSYVTPSWAHEAFGRKIEKAIYYRDERDRNIAIVSERHWVAQAEEKGG
ncbi:MAG: BRCT domain-containing protein [Gammaproteobacteria bacterium]|nr:BRCT domain-containing protein [Gammaproteobacteria bacterium]